jgi:outer membrane protein OmpA-like peptidoglycan-associated protein
MKALLLLINLLFIHIFQPQVQVKKLLPGSANTVKYTEHAPSISAGGKGRYFMRGVFDRSVKSEYACFKLMMAERGRDGTGKRPIELPAPINISCEEASRIMADNRTLLFSSVRKNGKGDFDLYKSVLQDDGSWSEPINLSFVNTKGLDQFVSVPPCGDVMYFTNGVDIYTVPLPEDLRPYSTAAVQGFVTDSLTGKPLSTKMVAFNEQGQRTHSEMDNNASDRRFTVFLEIGKQYTLLITQPGYHRKTIPLPPDALAQCGTFMPDIRLVPLPRAGGALVASASTAPAGAITQNPVAAASLVSEPISDKPQASLRAKLSAGKAVVTFQAFDKQTRQTIGGTFQLLGLKTKRKLSVVTTPEQPTLGLTFTESDTLYIVTSAKGYGDVSEPLWVGVDTDGETRYEYRAYLPPILGSTFVVNVKDAEIVRAVPGLKIVLQDETTGQSTPLLYDPKTMTARTTLDPGHRYTVAVDAPGYIPYRKYLDKVLNDNEVGILLQRKVQSRLALAATDQRTQKPIAATFKIMLPATRQVFVVEGKAGVPETFAFEKPGTYQIEASAPGYRAAVKEYVLTEKEIKAFDFKPALVPALTEYTFLVVDKDQRSVVANASVRVLDETKKPVNVSTTSGEFTVMLPDRGAFTYEVTAAEYLPVRGILDRPASRLIEVGMTRRQTAPSTQTIAFVAQDAFTQKPIAARFWLKGPETSPTATVTTAANPQYGTELKLQQPYTLKVESNGYENYSAPIMLDVPEAEPIKPRIVMMEPLAYEVNFTILDAVTMKPIDPASFQIGEAQKALKLQSQGNSRKVLLASGKQYDIRVGQPGYELFERTLTFDKPTGPKDLLKSILLTPIKTETKPTPAVVSPAPIPITPVAAKVDETVFENLKVGEAVRLDNVYFDQGSYILRTESYAQLEKLVKTLQVNTKLKVEIAGHTDNVGDARLNQYLSENRARVISSYLAGKGIGKDRLVPKGYGQTKPVAPNDTEENKAQNRRVEFVVLEN